MFIKVDYHLSSVLVDIVKSSLCFRRIFIQNVKFMGVTLTHFSIVNISRFFNMGFLKTFEGMWRGLHCNLIPPKHKYNHVIFFLMLQASVY